MSRMHALVTALGVLLVLFGFFGDGWPSEAGPAQAAPRVGVDARDLDRDGDGEREALSANTGRTVPLGALDGLDDSGPLTIEVRVVHAEDGSPVEGAPVELWRAARGTGVGYRPAKRLGAPGACTTDRSGRAELTAPVGLSLELVARLGPDHPPTSVPLGQVDAPLGRAVEIPVRRRPADLLVRVTAPDGEPMPGATLRLVHQRDVGRSEFPGGVVVARTDGRGEASLGGDARSAAFLVVDAAQAAPLALDLSDLGPGDDAALHLEAPAVLEVTLQLPEGMSTRDVAIEVDFELDGHRSRRTGLVDRRGVARIQGLPGGVPLVVRAASAGGNATESRPLLLDPGETRAVTLAHFPD